MPLPGDRSPQCLGPGRAALQPRGLDSHGQPLRFRVRKNPWALTQGGQAGHTGEAGWVLFPGDSAEPCLPPWRAHPCPHSRLPALGPGRACG